MPIDDQFLPPLDGPELVFALVGPVGANLSLLCDVLTVELSRVGYQSETIRLSGLLNVFEKYANLPSTPEEKRYHTYMDAGNEFRSILRRGDALAILAVSAVAEIRQTRTGAANVRASRLAYILRSLKHPREVEILRKIYGDALFVISAFSAREERIQTLARAFAKSHGDIQETAYREAAEGIVVRDEAELYNEFGQKVRETFPLADLFVRTDDRKGLEGELRRFVQMLFSYPIHTPTPDESGMFHARAAALRSADLSRQVGAAICGADGEILSMGCNDVPKAGGGLYWPGTEYDQRDFVVGYDSSARMKEDMVRESMSRMKKAGWLNKDMSLDDTVQQALYTGDQPILKSAQITDILEFGRIVHAEMAALMNSARSAISIQNTTLYCTTFPCHMCARHIVAAGIRRVVYIEPYPKSMAARLYPDSIVVEGGSRRGGVVFEAFTGVSPRSYVRLFEMIERKDKKGNAVAWREANATPRVEQLVESYIVVENKVLEALKTELDREGITEVEEGKDHGPTRVVDQAT